MPQNAYFLAKIGADTAENEQHFAEILPTDALWRGLPALRSAGAQRGRGSRRAGVLAEARRGGRLGERRRGGGGELTGELQQISKTPKNWVFYVC